jgi:hypothetical protein
MNLPQLLSKQAIGMNTEAYSCGISKQVILLSSLLFIHYQ